MRVYVTCFILIASLAACGGGSSGAAPAPVVSSPNPSPTGSSGPLVATRFTIDVAPEGSHAVRPSYVSTGTASVTITLETVNGGSPPAGLTTSVTSNITASTCTPSCIVNGPNVPPGDDGFEIDTFSGSNGSGSQLSSGSISQTITQGTTNAIGTTLEGIPASFSISGIPATPAAGAAFATPATLTIVALDASGQTISGTYANPLTIADSDTSSLTLGSALSVNDGPSASSVSVTASTDTIALSYGGLAIASATISISASGATTKTSTFTPTLNPIAPSTTQINLYATSGTGSTGTFTASENGWTNAPYNKSLTLSVPGACSSIAGVSPASGTSFTATAATSPSAGSCTTTLSDGASQSTGVTLTYTTYTYTIDTKPHRP